MLEDPREDDFSVGGLVTPRRSRGAAERGQLQK